ncbi:unnamed protein product [Ilex paraguariensis]|uniref:Uncharacterized protein n=1 Tax=Ilex paraguariensis TaxID=185542 RepID=A0ABC8S6E5_9AQUA
MTISYFIPSLGDRRKVGRKSGLRKRCLAVVKQQKTSSILIQGADAFKDIGTIRVVRSEDGTDWSNKRRDVN